jgi:hypothetical protein
MKPPFEHFRKRERKQVCESGSHREGVALRLLPPGDDFLPLALHESRWFLLPPGCSSGDSFLPTTRVVELLFPLNRSGGGCDSPSF